MSCWAIYCKAKILLIQKLVHWVGVSEWQTGLARNPMNMLDDLEANEIVQTSMSCLARNPLFASAI